MEALSTLEVADCMLGGEVHGSLDHAGKVRGQTPKVAKQEKKKTTTGRPKRRVQYNLCFSVLCLPLARRRALMLTPKSSVILAFCNKAT